MIKIKYLFLFLLCICLCACERKESFQDLRDYIKKLESSNANRPVKPTVISRPETVKYQKNAERTPFDETGVTENSKTISNNPMRAYPLNLLRFMGTISQHNQLTAYIMTPDNKLYQVTIGDTLGDHSGRIVKITANEVVIVEQATDEGKGAERIVTLQLKDEN